MAAYLLRKLAQSTALSAEEKTALERATGDRIRKLGPREDIIHEGDRPKHVNVILDGFACRYKMLHDGRRQIAAFLVPGDICDMGMFLLESMDHSIGTLSPVTLAEIRPRPSTSSRRRIRSLPAPSGGTRWWRRRSPANGS
jgi:CRP-like cAMP-binding protein